MQSRAASVPVAPAARSPPHAMRRSWPATVWSARRRPRWFWPVQRRPCCRWSPAIWPWERPSGTPAEAQPAKTSDRATWGSAATASSKRWSNVRADCISTGRWPAAAIRPMSWAFCSRSPRSGQRVVDRIAQGFTPAVNRGLVTGSEPVGEAARRWQIELGGRHRFRLRILPAGVASHRPQLALLRESRTYDFSLRGVDVSAQWRLQVHNDRSSKWWYCWIPGCNWSRPVAARRLVPGRLRRRPTAKATRVVLDACPSRSATTERVIRLDALGPTGPRPTLAAAANPRRGAFLAGREHHAADARSAGGRPDRAAGLRTDGHGAAFGAADRRVAAISGLRAGRHGRGVALAPSGHAAGVQRDGDRTGGRRGHCPSGGRLPRHRGGAICARGRRGPALDHRHCRVDAAGRRGRLDARTTPRPSHIDIDDAIVQIGRPGRKQAEIAMRCAPMAARPPPDACAAYRCRWPRAR